MSPRKLVKEGGKWIDRNDNDNEFKGHVKRQLDLGDEYEEMKEDGTKRNMRVTRKETDSRGFLYVYSVEVV